MYLINSEIKIFSFPPRNRQFVFEPKIQYKRAAELREAASETLQFPFWCGILKIVRTVFAAFGGEEPPPESAAPPRR